MEGAWDGLRFSSITRILLRVFALIGDSSNGLGHSVLAMSGEEGWREGRGKKNAWAGLSGIKSRGIPSLPNLGKGRGLVYMIYSFVFTAGVLISSLPWIIPDAAFRVPVLCNLISGLSTEVCRDPIT